jgi:hypothetical protein
VTCGCCAQAVEPVAFIVATSPDVPVADAPTFLPNLPQIDPHDILHVPKIRFA